MSSAKCRDSFWKKLCIYHPPPQKKGLQPTVWLNILIYHLFVFFYQQLAENPLKAAATMVHTFNKDKEKLKVGIDTICK